MSTRALCAWVMVRLKPVDWPRLASPAPPRALAPVLATKATRNCGTTTRVHGFHLADQVVLEIEAGR
jgi:hypothetical protein